VKHLVLLGGGHAHIHVLQALAQEPLPGTEVTLVSPFPCLMYSAMVPGLVAGHYGADDCVIQLEPLAAKARVGFVESMAIRLDAVGRKVELGNGHALTYDALSVDIGSVMDRDAIPGAREHGLFVRPMEHFTRMWEALFALAQQRSLSVVVIGGGPAGVELVLAMQYRLGDRARLSLVTGGPAPLSGYPLAVQQRARRALKRRGVTLFEDNCTQISSYQVHLGRGMRLQCDAPVLAIGVSAPAWLAGSGLALDAQGFITTGPTLQSISHPDVFSAGDVVSNAGHGRPKSGVYAVWAGPPLALNLRRHLAGGELLPHLPKPRSLNLLACGERSAIASWGRWSAEGFWAWYWKDRIDRGFIARYR
jgi:pyridine nucleotide-disulfide oxidoreductase family protein